MLSTSNISDVNYYLNTKYFSLAKEQLLDDKQFAGSLIHDLLINKKFNKEDFTNLCNGKITTVNGEYIELGRKNKDGELEHDMGRDLTFSAPKSVSLQHNMEGGDKRIKNALFKAAKETLDYIERNYTFTRVKDESGKIKLIKTGNFSASLLYENLNRNLEFDDHIHCTIFNATKRPDGNIRSLEFKKIIESKMHFGMIFRMNLMSQMQQLGYEIDITDDKYNFFEIKNFNQNLCKEFSQRTEEINQAALKLNKNPNAKTKELANLLTRKDKSNNVSIDDIKEVINEKIRQLKEKFNLTKEEILENIRLFTKNAKNDNISSKKSNNAKKAVGFAIEHLAERKGKAYFSNQEIMSNASNYISSHRLITSSDYVQKEISKMVAKKFLIPTEISNEYNQDCFGTRDSLEREKAVITICHEGKNKFQSVSSIRAIENYFKEQESNNVPKLNNGQLEAVKLILNSKDQVNIIQGYAGVGKTFAIGRAKEYLDHINEINNSNHQLIGLAPSGSAAKELESVIGKADTVQAFTRKYNGYANGRGTIDGIEEKKIQFKDKIFLIDESSMIGVNMMQDILMIAKTLDLKMVFLGDKDQILSIEAGLPFYQMQKEDLKMAKMTEIVRQTGKIDRAIAYSAYKKDFESVFKKIGSNFFCCSENADLLDEKNIENHHTSLAATKLYSSFSNKKQDETILITPSNSTRNITNSYIREILISRGRLNAAPINIIDQPILVNANLTIAQKGNYYYYQKEDIILFNRKIKRFNINKNEYFKILEINHDHKTLLLESLNNKDKVIIFDPAKSNSLRENIEYYNREERQYAVGEKIIFTRKIEEANQISKTKTEYKLPAIINSTMATITKIDQLNNKIEFKIANNESKQDEIVKLDLDNNIHQHILKHSDYGYCLTNFKSQGKTVKNTIIILESYFKYLADARNTLVSATRHKDNIYMITDNKKELIDQISENYTRKLTEEIPLINSKEDNKDLIKEKIILRENLFKYSGAEQVYTKYKLAIDNNQNIDKYYDQERDKSREAELKTENIDPKFTTSDDISGVSVADIIRGEGKKEEFVDLYKKIDQEFHHTKSNDEKKVIKNKEKTAPTKEKPKDKKSNITQKSKLSYYEKRQYILNNLSDHEIKEHFKNFIHDNFNNSDLTRLDEAIEKAFSNQGHYQRFGRNLSASIIWHGKAGSVKDFRTDQSEKWGIGNIKIEDHQLDQVKDQKSQYKTKKQYKEEYIKQKEEQKLKQIIEYNQKAKEAEKLFNYHKNQIFNKDQALREKRIRNHPYLKEKNLNNNDKIIKNNDIVITKDNRLLISAKNKDNQIRTIQSIDAKGNKRFLKGAEKQGNFFLIKGSKENENTIYLTEGVATAMSINHATNCPTIACFDAGNIEKTLKELTTKFKDKNFIIAADNDRFKLNKTSNKIEEKSQNIGKQKAINAAKKYNAKVILPNFKNPENKDHIKLLSDFNDLHKHYGIDHVKEQLHNRENYLELKGVRDQSKQHFEIVK
jgi:conjugative relaxase-like TrwC/TraI family protein